MPGRKTVHSRTCKMKDVVVKVTMKSMMPMTVITNHSSSSCFPFKLAIVNHVNMVL